MAARPVARTREGGFGRPFCVRRVVRSVVMRSAALWVVSAQAAAPPASVDVAAAVSAGVSVDVTPVWRHSRWEERAADGHTLLTERGWLPGLSVGWRVRRGEWDLGWRWTGVSGKRDYSGQTQSGQAAQTAVDLSQQQFSLDVARDVTPAWQLTLQAQPHWVRRNIRSTGAALGYVEHWQWTDVLLGARWRRMGDDGAVTLIGASLGALWRPTVKLTLPGSDALTLSPHTGRTVVLSATHQQPIGTWAGVPWFGVLGVDGERRHVAESPAVAVMRGGVLRGAAFQPDSRWQEVSLRVGLTAKW